MSLCSQSSKNKTYMSIADGCCPLPTYNHLSTSFQTVDKGSSPSPIRSKTCSVAFWQIMLQCVSSLVVQTQEVHCSKYICHIKDYYQSKQNIINSDNKQIWWIKDKLWACTPLIVYRFMIGNDRRKKTLKDSHRNKTYTKVSKLPKLYIV